MIALIFPFGLEKNAFVGNESGWQEEKVAGLTIWKHPKYNWILTIAGQGKVETALVCEALYTHFSPNFYVLLGAATALTPTLKCGDFIWGNRCVEWDFDANPAPSWEASAKVKELMPDIFSGTILSADKNVFAPEEKKALAQRFNAAAHAWEGAGLQRFLRKKNILGCELRCITETVDEGELDFARLKKNLNQYMPKVREYLGTLRYL